MKISGFRHQRMAAGTANATPLGRPMQRVTLRRSPLVLLVLATLCCVSCSSGTPCYPVRGKVFVNGKAAEGVTVVFHPIDDPDPNPVQPSAVVSADGSFALRSYFVKDRVLKDGAPAGKYRVTCVWYPADLQKYLAQEKLPDKLNGRFANPKTTELKAEVLEKDNELPTFQLTVPEK